MSTIVIKIVRKNFYETRVPFKNSKLQSIIHIGRKTNSHS